MESFDRDKNEPTISDVYFLLGSISGKLDGLIATQSKTIYALIALAGATLGLKLLGTPSIVVISRFVNMFVFLFASVVGFSLRGKMTGWYFICAYGVGGVVGNLMSLVGGEGATSSFRVPVFIVANLAMLAFLWGWDKWDRR